MVIALCSCTSNVSYGVTSGGSKESAPAEYEYEGVSVSSITAVVGDKVYLGFETVNNTTDNNTVVTNTYEYEELTDSDFDAYGEYLLQNGFEESQKNSYLKTTQDGVTLKINLDGNNVVVEGSKK